MTKHTPTRPICLAALAIVFLASTAVADPLDAATPLPWTGDGEHLVCDVSVSPLDRDLDVASWDRREDTSVLAVKRGGWYWLFDGAPRTDGTLQENETAWIRVSNPTNPEGRSAQQNCEREWVVADADAPRYRRYLGLFWLEQGPNAVTMHHACPLIRLGRCSDFQNGRPGSSCVSYSSNSVHLGADSVCAVQAPTTR